MPELQPEREPELVGAAVSSGATSPTGTGSSGGTRVWVVDGRPRFHAQDCLIIKGQTAEPMAQDEAEADGFQPCSLCQRRPF